MAKSSKTATTGAQQRVRTTAGEDALPGAYRTSNTKKCLIPECDLRYNGREFQIPYNPFSGERMFCDVHWSAISPAHQKCLRMNYAYERTPAKQSKAFQECLAIVQSEMGKAPKDV
jgi:hypothetical protein